MAANSEADLDIPLWKKHLIARLRVQNKCSGNGNSVVTVESSRRSSPHFQNKLTGRLPISQSSAGIPPSTSRCNQLSSSTSSSASKSESNPSFTGNDGKGVLSANKVGIKPGKMVQERAWAVDYNSCESVDMVSENDNYSKTSDSDSSEELHYGPGIVNKLKNKYLSLALRRETYTKQRPSILQLRKAASLENLLDEDEDEDLSTKMESEQRRKFQSNGIDKNSSNRYRNPKRGTQDMKRARSVEAISRFENMISPPPQIDNQRPKSLHEYILISDAKEGNDKPYRKPKDSKVVEFENNIENGLFSNNYVPRPNRPKRIAPMMNEREKPPADVVKQAKMIFEKRPEQRTKPPVTTGEVAAKVATYKNIIVQAKPVKKPPIKSKPSEKVVKNGTAKPVVNSRKTVEKPKVETRNKNENVSASEKVPPKITPRIKEMSRKNPEKISPPKPNKSESVKEEFPEKSIEVDVKLPSPIPDVSLIEFSNSESEISSRLCHTPDLIMTTTPMVVSTPLIDENGPFERKSEDPKNSESTNSDHCDPNRERLSVIETSPKENISFNEPLKLIINGNQSPRSPSPITQISPIPALSRRKILSPPIRPQNEPFVIDRVVEKNLINAAKSLEAPKAVRGIEIGKTELKNELKVPKKVRKPPREPESNSIVFKFTDRKDVPDYVQNDRSRTAGKLERPKVGEGGIILLPGASLDESFTDEDEEIMKFLQEPPSPCDVTFINDNILIDGKSSINQKTKKSRMRISFVESVPDVFEYPSESSLLIDDLPPPVSPTATSTLAGHTVPMLSGSSLANYTPKSTEEFQPGITRSVPVVPSLDSSETKQDLPDDVEMPIFEEKDQPITFSSGTNSDMLF